MWFFSVSEATADPAWKLFSAEVFRHRWRWKQLFRYLSFFRAVVVSMWSTIIVEPNKRNDDDDDDDADDSGNDNVDGNHRAIFSHWRASTSPIYFSFKFRFFSIPPSCFATSAKPGNPLRLLREFFFSFDCPISPAEMKTRPLEEIAPKLWKRDWRQKFQDSVKV